MKPAQIWPINFNRNARVYLRQQCIKILFTADFVRRCAAKRDQNVFLFPLLESANQRPLDQILKLRFFRVARFLDKLGNDGFDPIPYWRSGLQRCHKAVG